ncbi:MAG: hypothetical protein A2041_07215 [Bacteroidetes bacterium GWA2_31_9b]|nr:MAG: hypothetical protein A2041_07215 [Bacteroidetes bacterium GWA2_31_9b]
MFRNYYHYFIAGLTEIFFNESGINFGMPQFKKLLEEQIKPDDYKLVKLLFLPYDNENLLHFLNEEYDKFNPLGNYLQSDFEIEFSKERKNILPLYMYKFYDVYKNEEETPKIEKSWENVLTEMYYEYVLTTKNKFLKQWFEYNQNIKNILTGINCRKFNFNPEKHLISKNFITESIITNKSKDFGLDSDFPIVTSLLNISEKENFLASEREIDLLRWSKIDELTLFEYFTIDKVLAYTIKLDIAYRWLALDEEKGRIIFKQIIKDIKSGFEFTKEFALNGQNK